MQIECLFQGFGFHDVGMERRAGRNRTDPACNAVLIDVHDQIGADFLDRPIAERDHFAEFPGGIDVHQGKRQGRRIKRLDGEMQHDA
jgi:hypothetical protein